MTSRCVNHVYTMPPKLVSVIKKYWILTTERRLGHKPRFHRWNFTQELGTLGWYSVCFHSRNQDLNKVRVEKCPSESPCSRGSTFSKVRNFRGRDLSAKHADWLSSCSIVISTTIYSDNFQNMTVIVS